MVDLSRVDRGLAFGCVWDAAGADGDTFGRILWKDALWRYGERWSKSAWVTWGLLSHAMAVQLDRELAASKQLQETMEDVAKSQGDIIRHLTQRRDHYADIVRHHDENTTAAAGAAAQSAQTSSFVDESTQTDDYPMPGGWQVAWVKSYFNTVTGDRTYDEKDVPWTSAVVAPQPRPQRARSRSPRRRSSDSAAPCCE